jgi:hypothetical protein
MYKVHTFVRQYGEYENKTMARGVAEMVIEDTGVKQVFVTNLKSNETIVLFNPPDLFTKKLTRNNVVKIREIS